MASANAGPITGKERIRIIQGGWDIWVDRPQFASLLALSTLPNTGPRPYTAPTTILGTETISAWQDGAKITLNAGDITTYLAGSGTAPPHPDPNLATTFTGNELIMGHQSGFRVAWSIAEIAAIRAASDIFAGYSLAMPFKKGGIYRSNDTIAGSASGLPGWTFTRSGGKSRYGSDGVLYTVSANQQLMTDEGFWVESAFTNLLLNAGQAASLSTQNVFVTAQAYTLSFYGTGTITLSGVSTAGPLVGTIASNRSTLTFTPTTGTLTLTVTGSVTFAGLVAGALPGPIIATGGAATSVGADDPRLSQPIPIDEDFVFYVGDNQMSTGVTQSLATISDGSLNNRLNLSIQGTSLFGAALAGGTILINLPAPGAAIAGPGRVVIGIRRRAGRYTAFGKNPAGQMGLSAETAVVGFPSGMSRIDIGNQLGSQSANASIEFVGIKRGTFSDADLIDFMTGV